MKKELRITLLSEFAPILNTKKGLITMYQTYLHKMVGATGFEPAAFCSQSRRDTKLRYAPLLNKYIIKIYLC